MKLGANHPMGPLELGDFIGLPYKETACQPAIIQESLPKVDESLGRVTAILQEIKTQSGVVGELYQDMIDFEAIERLEEELLYKVLKQNKNGEE